MKGARPMVPTFGGPATFVPRLGNGVRQSSEYERTALDFLPSTLAAVITQRRDGGPMRLVGRRRGRHPGGLYYSRKTGRLVGHESDNEKFDFFRAEISPDVVGYREQPHTIEAEIDGVLQRYTPDREDQTADGRLTIVEVKDQFEADNDPAYHAKLDYFAEVYDRLGWSFRLVTRDEIRDPASFDTVENIQRFRRASYTVEDMIRVQRVFGGRCECELGELLAAFPCGALGLPKLCAMMVGRVVVLDIYSQLENSSLVRLP